MIDRLIIHIGTHKTGTTAIQGSLIDAGESLLERGILYPRAGRERGLGHAILARELDDTSGPPTETPSHLAVVEELQSTGASVLVISAERLSQARGNRPVAWARAACQQLAPREALIVGYVRPQWEYIESSYAQHVKDGTTWVPFEQDLERSLAERRFDYLSVFASWREAFGERLEVRPHSAGLLTGANAVDDFWQAAGLGSPPAARDRFANRRTGARTTEMLRALRALLADHRIDSLLPVQPVLRRARERIEAELADDLPFAPLTPELAARVAERFAASNEAFVRDYFGGRHASLFSPPTELEPSTWSLSEATDAELRLFAEIVEDALSQVHGGAPERAADPPARVQKKGLGSVRRRLGRARPEG